MSEEVKDLTAPQKVVMEEVKPAQLVRLDLGAGETPREGYEGVDLHAPSAKHKVDLWKFPWPWADDSVDEIHCSHFIEHLPMEYVKDGPHAGKDLFCAFFDECFRILKKDGKMSLIWPALQSVRAFQDPTHRRFIPAETMLYLNAEWRKINKLEHYGATCNFGFNVVPSTSQAETVRHQTVQANRTRELWNVAQDFHAMLSVIKP